MWCIPEITELYRTRMYDLLDLYAEEYDPKRPVVCIDEKSKQLLDDKKDPIPMKAGRAERYDYEYKRNGTRNIFVAVEPKAGTRVVSVTRRRKKKDFALFVRNLIDRQYPEAATVRIVCDNLNTHFEASFYETFPEAEAESILGKIEFHRTPCHASWLDMAEIEINVMERECLGKRRMKNEQFLMAELAAWQRRRNEQKKKIYWTFTRKKADKKLGKYYI